MTDPRIEPATPFTESEIAGIERIIGRSLPGDYRDFVRAHGGAFVGGLIDGDMELPIMAFFGADAIHSTLACLPDLREDCILPVAGCALGNLYVLDRGNAVHYVNYYGGRPTTRKVANSFCGLLTRVVVDEE